MQKNSRREFLKTTTKASVAVAVGGLALTGCKEDGKKIGVVEGKSVKDEVLYTGNTQYWKTYYSVAK
ncbi:twin-arginine translocation signal domain-containing protein [Helicobacter anatolicus]|uniref:twin-arginine translocation signal domain-containing protein n=1 Tax=Helicobacter anatolicus TaxID=2905874 RepID=UPI001E5624FE|nr:twin-arginine translocation signal domain-containing protein [Helicobacter anatolicus]MCE3036445.1 twin-arginine translocation signal domain-containing protein [Helicobacter anatolicus]MCE3039762.1 twin-arginine translocation signal domain-containing protein [Helicobacter anatolicus]